jgi:hypothetical protein
VQSTLGVGGCGNICFGHVLVAVRQGQRRNTVPTGEEQLGRCAAGQIKYNESWAPCKARWVWAGICFGHVPVAVRQVQRRDTVATGEEQLGRCAAGQIKYK